MYEDEIPVGRAKNLSGQVFGRLTVLYRAKGRDEAEDLAVGLNRGDHGQTAGGQHGIGATDAVLHIVQDGSVEIPDQVGMGKGHGVVSFLMRKERSQAWPLFCVVCFSVSLPKNQSSVVGT